VLLFEVFDEKVIIIHAVLIKRSQSIIIIQAQVAIPVGKKDLQKAFVINGIVVCNFVKTNKGYGRRGRKNLFFGTGIQQKK
jgi:hypothetical protein